MNPKSKNVKKLLANCNWPELDKPYKVALQEAVRFIFSHFDVHGIIASGTIVRGNPAPNSDLDIVVINQALKRQRIQKFFQDIPAEIFVNPPQSIEKYFKDEIYRGRPCTAHMLATGFVIFDQDPIIEQLRQQAQLILDTPPNPDQMRLTQLRYGAADRYENALDIADTNPAGASLMLTLAIYEMLHYSFWQAKQFLPRDKDLLTRLGELDPKLLGLVRPFFESSDMKERLTLAQKIADATIGVHGFFEWESHLEVVG